MLRRPLAALVTALSAASLALLPTTSAHAEGSCTFTPPAKIAIYQDVTILDADITGDCVPNGFASWYTGAYEDDDFASASFNSFDGEVDSTIYVPDVLDQYGVLTWSGDGAVNDADCDDDFRKEARATTKRDAAAKPPARTAVECEDLTQNEPVSDIRLGTYAALAGTRNSANRITFTVTSAIWSTGSDKLSNRSMKGELQTQYADGTWHRVGNPITTGANGKATFAVGLGVRTWRFGVYSTPYSFNRLSTTLTR